MFDLSLGNKTPAKQFASKFSTSGKMLNIVLKFEGPNREMIDNYYWFYNFPLYTGKAFTTLKLEDYHYFSESSQFGAQMRQSKGGSIQAFQQNLQQLIQLVKVHMFPLLQEVKQADFYHKWIGAIEENDEKIFDEKKKNNPDESKIKQWTLERDEAISHLKDKWVMEVDGGKLWQMNRSSTEQGLDYALLPQLFFGTSLKDPLQRKQTLKEQLDDYIYKVDISQGAKEQTARFLYRFYTWLPSAIRDTKVTFKLKIAALKQFYAQMQMYIEFMRPLLIEIAKKKEGFDKTNFYHGYEHENHFIANLTDISTSYIRNLGVMNLGVTDRGKHTMADLEFSRFGYFISGSWGDIWAGPAAGKSGFIYDEFSEKKGGKSYDFYKFVETGKKDISVEDFKKAINDKSKVFMINKEDLKIFPCLELQFKQKRRNTVKQSPQGAMQVPIIQNEIEFTSYCFNIVEIATYREKLKAQDLEILETFIAEISEMKDDLLKYVSEVDPTVDVFKEAFGKGEKSSGGSSGSKSKKKFELGQTESDMLFGPFQGLFSMLKPLIPTEIFSFNNSNKQSDSGDGKLNFNIHNDIKNKMLEIQLGCLEDSWKIYTVHKKANRFMQY